MNIFSITYHWERLDIGTISASAKRQILLHDQWSNTVNDLWHSCTILPYSMTTLLSTDGPQTLEMLSAN